MLVISTLSILWGSSFLAIKEVIDFIPPLFAFGIRFTVSGALLLVIYFIRGSASNREAICWKHWREALVLGALTILGGQGLLVWGAQYMSASVTALLNSTIPLWVVVFTTIVYRQYLTKAVITGLVLGFLGVLILVNPFEINKSLNVLGILALTFSSILWAVGSLYATKSKIPVSVVASGGMMMLLGGLMLFFMSYTMGEFHNLPAHVSAKTLAAFLYLILLCTAVGYTEFLWLLKDESPNIANSFAYIVPVVAVLLGWIILKEKLTFQMLASTCVIIAGVALLIGNSSRFKPKIK